MTTKVIFNDGETVVLKKGYFCDDQRLYEPKINYDHPVGIRDEGKEAKVWVFNTTDEIATLTDQMVTGKSLGLNKVASIEHTSPRTRR